MKLVAGFTFLEVIISLFIFAILLFGLDAMQVFTLHQTKEGYYLAFAHAKLNELGERLYAAKGNDIADKIPLWREEIQRNLPDGEGVLDGHYPNWTAKVSWGKKADCNKNKIGNSGCLLLDIVVSE